MPLKTCILSRTVPGLSWSCSQFLLSSSGYLAFTHYFSEILENIAINHLLQKTTFFGPHFCCRQCGSEFNHCEVIGPNSPNFGEITQNNCYYAVQGRSRSNGKAVCDFLCCERPSSAGMGTRRKSSRPRRSPPETETLTIFLETRPRRDVGTSETVSRPRRRDRDHNPGLVYVTIHDIVRVAG